MKNSIKVIAIVVIALFGSSNCAIAKTNLVEVKSSATDLVGIEIKYKAPDSSSSEPYIIVFFKTTKQNKKGFIVFHNVTPASVMMQDAKVVIKTTDPNDKDVKLLEYVIEVDKTYTMYFKKNGDVFSDNAYLASK